MCILTRARLLDRKPGNTLELVVGCDMFCLELLFTERVSNKAFLFPLQKGVFMMSIFHSVLPRVTRSNGWRCFSTGIPYDDIAELNKVRHLNIRFGCCLSLILFLLFPGYLTETRVLDIVCRRILT